MATRQVVITDPYRVMKDRTAILFKSSYEHPDGAFTTGVQLTFVGIHGGNQFGIDLTPEAAVKLGDALIAVAQEKI